MCYCCTFLMAFKIPSPREVGLPEKFDRWRPDQEEAIRLICTSPKRFKALAAPTGFGKCFAPGTKVLMFNGEVRDIEDIEVGESVMGPDSQPRVVTGLASGIDQMFEIVPTKGDSYTVNSAHILCLRMTAGAKDEWTDITITLDKYLRSNRTFRHRAKGYRVGVHFSSGDLPLEPYFVGLWLGDGSSRAAAVTTADKEIIEYLGDYADSYGLTVRVQRGKSCPTYHLTCGTGRGRGGNPITGLLRHIGVLNYKHIPLIYKTASIQHRRLLLAGLIDSDGFYCNGGYEITQKSRALAHDTAYIARSLGMAAYVTPVEKGCQTGATDIYYRVGISGGTEGIPVILDRKRALPRRQKKSVNVVGIRIRAVGEGIYHGFTLDGPDGKFLLGDFTVVHNTPAYVAGALLSQLPTALVTESRALQSQILNEFDSCGVADLRGRRNYDCGFGDTCEEGYARRCPYKGSVTCPSSQAEMRAATSMLVVTNYDKWTASRKAGALQHIEQVVFDEAHSAPDALARAMQVTLNYHEMNELLGLDFPDARQADEFVNWKPWLATARAAAEAARIAVRVRIAQASQPKRQWVRELVHFQNLCRKLAVLSTANPNNWIVEEVDKGYQFDPVRPGRYAEGALFCGIQSVVVVSATLRPKTLFMLGVPQTDFEFREFDSSFDPARCPIYHIPTMRVDKRATDLSMLWVRLDQIAARRQDRKGIVHTISYARRDEIMAKSRFAPKMLINPRGEAATDIIEQFRRSPAGTMLVSPSVGAGFDFAGRDCEFQFICKIPFPDGRSKIVQARQSDDKEYGAYQAMNKLVQTFGRGMRSQEDRCENFIADDHIEWFLPRYRHLAPRSFHAFFRRVDSVPPPPDRL